MCPDLRRPPGGRSVLPVGALYTQDRSIRGFAMFNATTDEQRRAADDINRWAAAGQLKAPSYRAFPLDQTAEAQRVMEAATGGGAIKAVVTID